jgi:murein tripeptide amidase MpaA
MKKLSLALAALFLLALVFVALFEDEEVLVEEAPVVLEVAEEYPIVETIGSSVLGREIETYTYGSGETKILFVGGIHGGYEWNSTLLAYDYIDYLSENIEGIPENITVAIIPVLNPDGMYEVIQEEGRFSKDGVPLNVEPVGLGRFNANDVDLNRNFGCNWQEESTWRGETVSAGSEAFSEPEAKTLKKYVEENDLVAVVFWHSQANAVYASYCNDGPLPETLTIMNTYANAAGYNAIESFDAYPVTGDSEGWLASIGIPAITVELKTHEDVEFDRNLKGINALIEHYETKPSS